MASYEENGHLLQREEFLSADLSEKVHTTQEPWMLMQQGLKHYVRIV